MLVLVSDNCDHLEAANKGRADVLDFFVNSKDKNKKIWIHQTNLSVIQRETVSHITTCTRFSFYKYTSYFVCVCVAPDLAIDPGSGHHPVVLVLQPFGPIAAVDGWQQSSTWIADVYFSVFAAGGPDHRASKRVILDVESELSVVIVDLSYSGALVEVYGQQVPVMCLKRRKKISEMSTRWRTKENFLIWLLHDNHTF